MKSTQQGEGGKEENKRGLSGSLSWGRLTKKGRKWCAGTPVGKTPCRVRVGTGLQPVILGKRKEGRGKGYKPELSHMITRRRRGMGTAVAHHATLMEPVKGGDREKK